MPREPIYTTLTRLSGNPSRASFEPPHHEHLFVHYTFSSNLILYSSCARLVYLHQQHANRSPQSSASPQDGARALIWLTKSIMDRQSVYTLSVLAPDEDDNSRTRIQSSLREFILEFRLDNAFIYRDQIKQNVLVKQYFCDVDIAHLISYDEELAHRLTTEPAEIIPLVGIAHRKGKPELMEILV
jgi:hypothetical protein